MSERLGRDPGRVSQGPGLVTRFRGQTPPLLKGPDPSLRPSTGRTMLVTRGVPSLVRGRSRGRSSKGDGPRKDPTPGSRPERGSCLGEGGRPLSLRRASSKQSYVQARVPRPHHSSNSCARAEQKGVTHTTRTPAPSMSRTSTGSKKNPWVEGGPKESEGSPSRSSIVLGSITGGPGAQVGSLPWVSRSTTGGSRPWQHPSPSGRSGLEERTNTTSL